jgi:hypothetical protein
MEIINKRERLTFADGWKKRRVIMVSLDGIVKMFKTNAHTIWVYSFTCVSAYTWCSCATGGGEGFKSIFNFFWEVRAWALIMCSSYNVSQLLAMYW